MCNIYTIYAACTIYLCWCGVGRRYLSYTAHRLMFHEIHSERAAAKCTRRQEHVCIQWSAKVITQTTCMHKRTTKIFVK